MVTLVSESWKMCDSPVGSRPNSFIISKILEITAFDSSSELKTKVNLIG